MPQMTSYWSHWTSDYDYVYVLFTDADYRIRIRRV